MFRQHPQQIEKLVRSIVRANGLETPLLQRRVIAAWDEVAGPLVARYTVDKRIQNQTLWVRIQNPAIRSEVSMIKTDLMRQLNAKVGSNVIYDIRIN